MGMGHAMAPKGTADIAQCPNIHTIGPTTKTIRMAIVLNEKPC